MLLRFSFENFRTFKDKTTLSMVASPQTTHNHILIREGNRRVLPAAILYGANASGKSNVVLAMQVLCAIVKNGTIARTSNYHLSILELLPFLHDGGNEQIAFEIEFVENKMQYFYRVSFCVDPLNRQGQRYIDEEILSMWESNKKRTKLFTRTRNNIELGNDKLALKYLGHKDIDVLQSLAISVMQNMDDETLFLSGGFRSAICKVVADVIINYLTSKIMPISDLSSLDLSKIVYEIRGDAPVGAWMVRDELFHAIKNAADFGPQFFVLHPKETGKPETQELEILSVYKYGETNEALPLALMESVGTTRFLRFAWPLKHILEHGGTFLIDEMDNSIHPEITKAILAIFCNPDINKHGAQLLFTSHNPIFMDKDLLRRDQILFVEKDPDTYKSSLYALSDFGSVNVRNDQDFVKNYFKGRYGRLPYIDLEGILAAAMEEKNEQKD